MTTSLTFASTLDSLPILAEGEVLVVGGSFAGAAAALEAAKAGRKVTLVEPLTYLGREATAELRPWFQLGEDRANQPLPHLVQGCLSGAGAADYAGDLVPFYAGTLKIYLEDRLLEAGVILLYASQPVGLVLDDSPRVRGLVIGNKSGRQIVTAQVIIDASQTALVARLGEIPLPKRNGPSLFSRTLEFDRVGAVVFGMLTVPESLGLVNNLVRLVPGARGEGHVLVECPLTLDNDDGALAWTQREIEARERTMDAAGYLIHQVPAFKSAVLASGAALLHGPIFSTPDWLEEMPKDKARASSDAEWLLNQPLPGLFLLSPTAAVTPDLSDQLNDPLDAAALGQALGQRIGADDILFSATVDEVNVPDPAAETTTNAPDLVVKEPEGPQRSRDYKRWPVPQLALPVLGQVDVLVVGGGTSGATAAAVAARNRARTLLAELNTNLGGTGTLGGVHSYWFGRRVGYAREVIEAVAGVHDELGLDPPQGSLLKWNIEAKMLALLRRAHQAGAELLFGAIVTGAILDGQRVRGVMVATPYGPAALLGTAVIDATGDGDVAAFARAPFEYGAARDHITMWYSLAQFYRPGYTQNNFTSMVDVSNVEDYTRAILAGRRRFEGHDQGTYIAPRESRHILGDVVLTLNDQLLKRRWPDVVSIAFSNHDVKGHTSSDWLRIGLIPPNLEVEIPYRALLPRGLEGILVVGKAISATHDAQPAIRMQPDLENLGGAAGLAAAMAAVSGQIPRELDLPSLQAVLVQDGLLPEAIPTRDVDAGEPALPDLQALLEAIDPTQPLYTYQDMELDVVFEGRIPLVDLCCSGPQVVPFLEKVLEGSSGAHRLMIARALALVGSQAGVPDLITAIQAETRDEGLQRQRGHIRHANLPPDQGAMPDVVYLIYNLGMARDERAIPVWEHFANLAAEASPQDLRDRTLGLFYYVDAICYGAERLGNPRAVPALRRLHDSPLFNGRVNRTGFEPDFFLERQAYLELVIGRALARCGDRLGLEILVSYLDDSRALLTGHAHSELAAICGEDLGKNARAWQDWLVTHQPAQRQVTDPNEPVQAWGTTENKL